MQQAVKSSKRVVRKLRLQIKQSYLLVWYGFVFEVIFGCSPKSCHSRHWVDFSLQPESIQKCQAWWKSCHFCLHLALIPVANSEWTDSLTSPINVHLFSYHRPRWMVAPTSPRAPLLQRLSTAPYFYALRMLSETPRKNPGIEALTGRWGYFCDRQETAWKDTVGEKRSCSSLHTDV